MAAVSPLEAALKAVARAGRAGEGEHPAKVATPLTAALSGLVVQLSVPDEAVKRD